MKEKMSKLKIAIQKSGRLSENSRTLFEECGIKLSNGAGTLKIVASNFPIEILFLRDDDIPQYVEQGVADIGIVGENMAFEKNKEVDILEQLGFAVLQAEPGNLKGGELLRSRFFHEQESGNKLSAVIGRIPYKE